MGRKDRERYQQLKRENPDYQGFRGTPAVTVKAPTVTDSVVCSVCNRRRNVSVESIPEDRSAFVCLRCREE